MAGGDSTELAAALRQWRERMRPGEAGLPAGAARRTPGLRREEVAQLAGLSVDYVVRLEQDRGPNPSESVLAALARALRLSTAETQHLFALAGAALPGPGRVSDVVRPSVLRLLDRMGDLPAMLANGRQEILAWNPLATALLGDLSAVPAERRNHLWLHFGDEPGFTSRLVLDDQDGPRLDRNTVAQARRDLARYPNDDRLRATIDELRATSTRFAALWDGRPVEPRLADVKTYDVPDIGPITVDCEALQIPDDDQVIVVYSAAPGTPDAAKLDRLRAVAAEVGPT